jgi:hypothetical protein
VAQNNTNRSSAIDARTTRHAGYAISQQKRKRVSWWFTLVGAAYNLVRLRRLKAEATA